MKSLRIFSLLLIGFCYCPVVLAQAGVSIDMTYTSAGQSKSAVTGLHYEEIEGNPYLYDTWLLGVAKLSDGNTYKDIFLKYDVVNNMLIFKYSLKDSALAFKVAPVEFVLQSPDDAGRSMYFCNGFAATDGADNKTFYCVMSQGTVKLLKRVKKEIQVSSGEMNGNLKKRTILESDSYYIARGDTPVKFKKDKKAILNVLSDQAVQLQKYISDNNLDLKKDDDLKQLIDHYNELKKT
jgi:hypothetical protein